MQNRPQTTQHVPASLNTPAKQRIEDAAPQLFRFYGATVYELRIAALAETNMETLLKYTNSQKLLLKYIETQRKEADELWEECIKEAPDDPLAQLRGWLATAACLADSWGDCHRQLLRMAEQLYTLSQQKPRAMRPLDDWRKSEHRKIVDLCRKAGLKSPEKLADKLMMLVDGARSNRGCFDYEINTMESASEALLMAHGAKLPPELED